MFLKLKPLIFSLLFLFGMEIFFLFNSFVFWIMGALTIFSLIIGKTTSGKWIYSLSLSLLTVFSGALFYLITFALEKQIFIIISSAMYYLILLGAFRLKSAPEDKTAKGMIVSGSFATLFFALTSFYGFYLNFLIPVFALLLTYFLITFVVGCQTLSLLEKDRKKIIIYSSTASFILAQIAWALNFWPFGYLTTGVIALILYYVIWEIIRSHFLLILSKKRIVWQIISLSFLIFIVLLSSKWLPVF